MSYFLQFCLGQVNIILIIWISFCPLQFSFDVGFLAIFGQLDETYREKLKENYCIVDKGYNSFPTKIPGTAYPKALLVSNTSLILYLNLTYYV